MSHPGLLLQGTLNITYQIDNIPDMGIWTLQGRMATYSIKSDHSKLLEKGKLHPKS
jgi:hypothetical protein